MTPQPVNDPTTETLVHAFLDLIAERKIAGKEVLTATHATIAAWLRERTGLPVQPRHVQVLTGAMEEAGLITVGGSGIGLPNWYDTTEEAMGTEHFWNQVDAFLMVWRHPSSPSLDRERQLRRT